MHVSHLTKLTVRDGQVDKFSSVKMGNIKLRAGFEFIPLVFGTSVLTITLDLPPDAITICTTMRLCGSSAFSTDYSHIHSIYFIY